MADLTPSPNTNPENPTTDVETGNEEVQGFADRANELLGTDFSLDSVMTRLEDSTKETANSIVQSALNKEDSEGFDWKTAGIGALTGLVSIFAITQVKKIFASSEDARSEIDQQGERSVGKIMGLFAGGAFAGLLAALGIKKFAEARRDVQEETEEEREDLRASVDSQSNSAAEEERNDSAQNEENSAQTVSAQNGSENEADEFQPIEFEDPQYEAETTELLSRVPGKVDQALFIWMRIYLRYWSGDEEKVKNEMETLLSGRNLDSDQRKKIGAMMVERGVALIPEDGGVWILTSPDTRFELELREEEMTAFVEAVEWPEAKEIVDTQSSTGFVIGGAAVVLTAAATIGMYARDRFKNGANASILRNFSRVAGAPITALKVMSKPARIATGEIKSRLLGWVSRRGDRLFVHNNAGRILHELQLDADGSIKNVDDTGRIGENVEKITDPERIKEQVEKISAVDEKVLDEMARIENEKREIRRKATERLIPFDDPRVEGELKAVSVEGIESVKNLYVERIHLTAELRPADVEANNVTLDEGVLKTTGLETRIPLDVKVEKNALSSRVGDLKLRGLGALRFMASGGKSLALMAMVVCGIFEGMRHLSKFDEEEFELDPDKENTFTANELRMDMMQFNSEYEDFLKYAADPEKFNELTEEQRIDLVEDAIAKHKIAVAKLMNLMMVNSHILNAAFKDQPEAVMAINPFLKIKYDSERGESYLEYPNEDEMKQVCFTLIDMGTKEHGELLGEAVEGSIPVWGDLKGLFWGDGNVVQNFRRGNTKGIGWDIALNTGGLILDASGFGILAGGAVEGAKLSRRAAKIISVLEKHSGAIFMGPIALHAGKLGMERLGWLSHQSFENRYYATTADNAQDIPFEAPDSIDLEHPPENIEESNFELVKNYYDRVLITLRTECLWKNMRYEVVDRDTVRMYRAKHGYSLTIKRENDQKWTIEGLGLSYNSFDKAAAMANMINDVHELIDKNGYKGGEDNPFEEEDGAVDMDLAAGSALGTTDEWYGFITDTAREVVQSDLRILDPEDHDWMRFYNEELGLSASDIAGALNAWYKNK